MTKIAFRCPLDNIPCNLDPCIAKQACAHPRVTRSIADHPTRGPVDTYEIALPSAAELRDEMRQALAKYHTACAAILAMDPIAASDECVPAWLNTAERIRWAGAYNTALQNVLAILAAHGITKDS